MQINSADIQCGDCTPPVTDWSVGTPQNGCASFNACGTLIYTPNPGFVGVDTFSLSYPYTDNNGFQPVTSAMPSKSAVVNVGDPIAKPFDLNLENERLLPGATLSIDAGSGLLDLPAAGATNVTGFTIIQQPTYGTLLTSPDGSFTYTADPGYADPDGFYYVWNDAAGMQSPESVVGIETNSMLTWTASDDNSSACQTAAAKRDLNQ